MFTVNRNNGRSGDIAKGGYDGPGGDEALFIGKSEPFALTQCFECDRKSSESDDTIDDNISDIDHRLQLRDNFDAWQSLVHLSTSSLVCDSDDFGLPLLRLCNDSIGRGIDCKCSYDIGVAFCTYDVECLSADRPGRTGDSDSHRLHDVQGCSTNSK